jgi:hypothetical protein
LLSQDSPYANAVATSPAGSISDELADLLAEHDLASLEDVQLFADHFMLAKNKQSTDDFHGLSPDIMHNMLHFPFESPALFDFPSDLQGKIDAPILTLLTCLFDQIGDGVKPTATGNLPLKICRAVRLEFDAKHSNYAKAFWPFRVRPINTEPDFMDLHVARLLAELSGLLRVYRGKFVLTSACKKLIKKGNTARYPLLLTTYCRKYNWGFRDGYEEMPFIQHGFLFSVYLLQLYGARWRDSEFYADNTLKAFPIVLEEVGEYRYAEPDEIFKRCYTLRCLRHFFGVFGLAEFRNLERPDLTEAFELRATPLLGTAVRFTSPDVGGNQADR